MSTKYTYLSVFLLVMSSLLGLLTVFVCLPDTASAETNPPTTAENWDDVSVDPAGRPVYNNGVGMDWLIVPGDDLEYEDSTLSIGGYVTQTGGTLLAKNCTIWLNNAVDLAVAIQVINGEMTLVNCTVEHKGHRNESVTEKAWQLCIDEGIAEDVPVFTCFNSSFNSTESATYEEGNPLTYNLVVDDGELISYHSHFELARQYYKNDADQTSYVNTNTSGEMYIADVTTEVNFFTAHYFTLIDNDTSEQTVVLKDADGTTLATPDNATVPAGYGLLASYCYAPDLSCYWFVLLNCTLDSTGFTDVSAEYPYTLTFDKPPARRVNSRYSSYGFAPRDHCLDKHLDQPNQAGGDWEITQAKVEGYETSVDTTTAMAFTSTTASVILYSPASRDESDSPWFYVNTSDEGSAWVMYTPPESGTGDDDEDNDSDDDDAGDDDDTDTPVSNSSFSSNPPSVPATSGSTSSGTVESGYWSENWYKIYTGTWWGNLWDEVSNFTGTGWVIIGCSILVLFLVIEFSTKGAVTRNFFSLFRRR